MPQEHPHTAYQTVEDVMQSTQQTSKQQPSKQSDAEHSNDKAGC
jgi:hypothetical protein